MSKDDLNKPNRESDLVLPSGLNKEGHHVCDVEVWIKECIFRVDNRITDGIRISGVLCQDPTEFIEVMSTHDLIPQGWKDIVINYLAEKAIFGDKNG